MEAMESILVHRRSRVNQLVRASISVVFMVPFLYWVAWGFSFHPFIVWGLVLLGAFNLVLTAHAAWWVWKMPGGFRCELDAARIRCRSPHPSLGDSFDLALEELAAIRHDSFGEKYLLVTRDGREFWLTSNFRNRPWRFVEAIRQLRPELPYRQS